MAKPKTGIIVVIVVIVAIALGVVVAMGGSSKDSKATTDSTANTSSTASSNNSSSMNDAAVETTSVEIKDYMFTPMSIKVKVGDTVTWTNKDAVKHNVVADTPSSDAPDGPLLAQGESYKFTFKKAGTYKIHCDPHPYMVETITVSE